MLISNALLLSCLIGGGVGALARVYFPSIFHSKEKQNQYEKLRPIATLILGVLIGFGISIFFEADVQGFAEVHLSYIKKLGLLTALYVYSTIDKLDRNIAKVMNKMFEGK